MVAPPAIQLRHYQVNGIESCVRAWKTVHHPGDAAPMLVLPTGCGKTATALALVARVRERKGGRVLWLAHRSELLTQPMKAWAAMYPGKGRAGIVKAERQDIGADVIFASIDTLRNDKRLTALLSKGAPFLVIVDECHHSMAATHLKVIRALEEASFAEHGNVYRLGLTATPERSDKKDLSILWKITYSYPVWSAWEEGFLIKPTPVRRVMPDLDLSKVQTNAGGDFDDAALAKELLAAHVVDHTVDALKGLKGRSVLVFTASVQQAEETAAEARKMGWNARFLDGETKQDDRDRLIHGFLKGEINCLCNVGVLTEGTDLPICNAIIVARPTKSKSLYMQIIGRGSRLYPGKRDCIVVDLVGATDQHNVIIAPVLLKQLEKEKPVVDAVEAKEEEVVDPLKKTIRKGFKAAVPLARANWVQLSQIDRQAWACDCGNVGRVVLLEQAQDRWLPILFDAQGATVDMHINDGVEFEIAQQVGEDIARKAASLTDRRAGWRERPLTENQQRLLDRFGVSTVGLKCGDASDVISQRILRDILFRAGFVKVHRGV
jgi:superfamily II DNA or RNA helicase